MRMIFDNIISVFVIVIVLLIIIPLPSAMLDVLLLINISLSFIILLITMYIKESLEFSIFPSLLLVTTLFRLALNISSTRLILGQGGAAGKVIETFGNFVIQGNYIVGFIIFLIILIIQFLVITKGAERVAEVAARFTLDAMPGKQMAIDADLNTGVINETQARERREKIARESEFYGSMDGATKFVKGDAIVSLIVTIINLVGGIIIGYITGVNDVIGTYTIATVGDGLVSQIPALLISTATGMVVTRAASQNSLSKDVMDQFSRMPVAMIVTGTLMLVMTFIPGFPIFTLLILGMIMTALGILQITGARRKEAAALAAAVPEPQEHIVTEAELMRDPNNIYLFMEFEQIEVEYGYSLLPIFNERQGSNITDRTINFRKKFAEDMGIVIPVISFIDNIRIPPNNYIIKIKGEEVASGEVLPNHYMIMDSSGSFGDIDGIDTTEPTYGIPAKWVTPANIDKAEMLGYAVIDPQSVIIAHLSEIIKKYAYEIVDRSDIDKLLENVKKKNKNLVEEVIGPVLPTASFHRIIRNLLKEQIPVKDLVTIIETIADYAPQSGNDTDLLTEYCRQALYRTITRIYSEDGVIRLVILDKEFENSMMKSFNKTAAGVYFNLDQQAIQNMLVSLNENLKKLEDIGAPHIILTSPGVRIYYKQFIEKFIPTLTVLSYSEIDAKTEIQSLGVVGSAA